ncbi:hypothetical protein F152LOC_04361 [Pectobacterium brasiliense]|nr:hypothetical protein F152LOC_04361 [Pectobacterium brasiliense]
MYGIYHLDKYIGREIINQCPLCNSPMLDTDGCTTISSGGVKCLAHHHCAIDKIPPENAED